MILHYLPLSPYARKVRVLAIETGIMEKITLNRMPVWDEPDRIRPINPLAKIPTLELSDGTALYDSHTIAAYLDTLHNGPKMIPQGSLHWSVLTVQALASGISDAAISCRIDLMRNFDYLGDWYAQRMLDTVKQGLAESERQLPVLEGTVNLGSIAIACAIGFLDLRFPELEWRKDCPGLGSWYDDFVQRPSMMSTPPEE